MVERLPNPEPSEVPAVYGGAHEACNRAWRQQNGSAPMFGFRDLPLFATKGSRPGGSLEKPWAPNKPVARPSLCRLTLKSEPTWRRHVFVTRPEVPCLSRRPKLSNAWHAVRIAAMPSCNGGSANGGSYERARTAR